jgi:saccharopine dehydrogenase (NAD+, L-lysine-forming)
MIILYLRKETKENEYRTPLTPHDCHILIKNNYEIQFEPSINRCYKNEEYEKVGCISKNVNDINDSTIIIGVKEFNTDELTLFSHKHFYFSHAFKGQKNAHYIINCFQENHGYIYDYEYIVDENGRRVIAFGYWAGFAGMYLGLLQYNKQLVGENIEDLVPIFDISEIYDTLHKYTTTKPKITICGAYGRCGIGCLEFLKSVDIIPYICNKNETIPEDTEIFINAIYLSKESDIVFFDEITIQNYKQLKVIVDISCDIHSKNNPIKLEYQMTSFTMPIYKYTDNIDIICIDNLPSLLPKNSSDEFSKKLTELFLSGVIEEFMKTFRYIQV